MQQDTPQIAKRRAREEKTISQMVALYCAGNHEPASRTETAVCGEAVCPECAQLDEYAAVRIRQVMRYSGPRMITKHPVAAIRHLLGR